jgi:hypothetical protein
MPEDSTLAHFPALCHGWRIVRLALLLALSFPLVASARPPATPAPSRQEIVENRVDYDMSKVFNMDQLSRTGTANKTFYTRGARTDSFYFEQKFQPKGYDTREYQSKGFWGRLFSFGTKSADTKTYETKAMETKTAATKEAYDSGKTASTRDLPDGKREYLGPEAKAMKKQLDPNNLPRITNEMHELKTVDDIRALLNKNK